MQKTDVVAHVPLHAGILLGVGLGAFFDGIVLHQILQWHHMASSAGYPPDSLANLRINTVFDGLFHVAAYAFVVAGLVALWRAGRAAWRCWPASVAWGSVLTGFGGFNLAEGVIDHHLLGLHHVNETVPRAQWIYWDLGFLALGAALVALGWFLVRRPHGRQAG